MKHYPFVFITLILLSACSQVSKEPSNIFTAIGYAPIAEQSGKSFDLKMLNAIKASKIEAYKEMAEQVYGVQLMATTNLEGAILVDDEIKTTVQGVVRGARVIKSYHEGDVYITELELDTRNLLFLREGRRVSIVKSNSHIYY